MSERSESLAVDEDLEGELLVDDGQIEDLVLLERERSLPLLLAPDIVHHSVSDDGLLVVADRHLECVLLVRSVEVDVHSFA